MKLIGVAALLLAATTGARASGVCPPSMPEFVGSLDYVVDGTDYGGYDWVVSPTYPSSTTPSPDYACPSASYLQQYGSTDGLCAYSLSVLISAKPTANGCTYTFTDRSVITATVELTCNKTSTALAMSKPVNATSQDNGMYLVKLVGSTSTVCGDLPPPPPNGVCPPAHSNALPEFVGDRFQSYQLSLTPYDWVISPTALSNTTPFGDEPCGFASYIQQFVPNGPCVAQMATFVSAKPTASGCTYTFSDGFRNTAIIALTCNESSSALAIGPVVDVPAQYHPTTFVFSFTGSAKAVCPP